MKFMNMKRFGAAAMTGALALSLAAPAFAASSTITGAFEAVDLQVTVSQTGAALINPYGLPVELKSGAAGSEDVDATISGEQVTTAAPLTIANGSAVALAVSATVTGAEVGDAKLVSDINANVVTGDNADTPKNIVARFEAFPAPGIDGDTIADAAIVINGSTSADDKTAKYAADSALNTAFGALKSEDAVLTAPVLTDASVAEGTLILREGDDGTALEGGVAFFRLAGEVVKNPTAAWVEADPTATPNPIVGDGFTATIAFTFEPSEYVGAATVSGAESVSVGATAKLTVSGLPSGVKAQYNTIKWSSSKAANATVADGTKKPTGTIDNTTMVELNTLTGTVTGVKAGSTVITVEFKGSDGVTYRGTASVKVV